MTQPPTTTPRRKLSAILFADVAGYARLMRDYEEETFVRITRALELFRALIGDYGGRVVDTAGDGVFAVFDSTMEALRFAQEISSASCAMTVCGPVARSRSVFASASTPAR